jgi:hypothetical protein
MVEGKDSSDNSVPDSTDGGRSGKLAETESTPILVSPSSKDGLNTLRLRLLPIACWRVDDVRFAFDSSFVLPGAKSEMALLATLIEDQTANDPRGRPPALSVFAHADPVGDDDYNKALSGRRAAAIYGLLTRRDEVWEDLFSDKGAFAKPAAGDKWGTRAIQTMLSTVGSPIAVDGELGPETRGAVEDFQTQNGLAVDGEPGPDTRAKLFLAFMDAICVNDAGEPFRVDKVDGFLGAGADAGGKGDFQGCSEFNPVLVFSKAENDAFTSATDKSQRNAANAANRRVMVLLFRPGSRVDAAKWPCPRAKEGADGCKARFYVDGEKRRSDRLPDDEREYAKSHDTFACRFYDRISNDSPCEGNLPFGGNPVYFCALGEEVPVLDAPRADAKQVGKLGPGDLVRALAEKFEPDAFFVRIERIATDPPPSYYTARRQPPDAEWICVSRDGESFAFWSNIAGASLRPVSTSVDFDGMDDRFAKDFLDV